jgi:hypothetical protein
MLLQSEPHAKPNPGSESGPPSLHELGPDENHEVVRGLQSVTFPAGDGVRTPDDDGMVTLVTSEYSFRTRHDPEVLRVEIAHGSSVPMVVRQLRQLADALDSLTQERTPLWAILAPSYDEDSLQGFVIDGHGFRLLP